MARYDAAWLNLSFASQGMGHPLQKRCHSQRAHQSPVFCTSFKVNGYSYRRLSSLKLNGSI